jgi:D-serine deaminase-like pyridoxal phosphate-dependent protein
MRLTEIQTPALILDRQGLISNVEKMTSLINSKGINLRPHLKTCKSIDVARLVLEGNFGGITVATLNEAEYFAAHGIRDILYGVCVSADKLARITALQSKGIQITLITDSLEVASELARQASAKGPKLRVMVEIDCGEHRTGVSTDDPRLIEIAGCLQQSSKLDFAGVFTHAGHSYQCKSIAGIKQIAEDERLAVVDAADRLRSSGLPCDQLSVGSTPTALHAPSVDGITEVRAGVYVFNDLFQASLGSCDIDDIAVSVLATVISHDRRRNRLLIDAGGLALSKDRSTAGTDHDAGFGRLLDTSGQSLIEDLCVTDTHQEHGEVSSERPLPFDLLPIGSRLRVLPNHACMTSAMYDYYHVVDGADETVTELWPRTNGWQAANTAIGASDLETTS